MVVLRWFLGVHAEPSYAERYPRRVSEIVIVDVTTTRRSEIDWLYRGVARFFPAEWERFRDGVPAADRDGELVAAYARLMEDPDPLVRSQAANDWCAWEDAVISLESNGKPNVYSDRPPAALLAFVRICAHYFAHGAWLKEGALLRDAARLAGIPGVLIHGRLDLSGPLDTAGALARAWPDANSLSSTTPDTPAVTRWASGYSARSTPSPNSKPTNEPSSHYPTPARTVSPSTRRSSVGR